MESLLNKQPHHNLLFKRVLDIIDMFRPYHLSMIDRYILKDFTKMTLMSMILFIVIYLFSQLINDIPHFINQMESNKNITLNRILLMYLNEIPYRALWVSPLAFLFSNIYTMGNFYKNNEAVAYIGAGVHLLRLTLPILIVSLIYSLLLIPITDLVIVRTYDKSIKLRRTMLNKFEPDRTRDFETFGQNNFYYFIKQFDSVNKVMHYPIIAQARSIQGDELAYNKDAFSFDEDKPLPSPKKSPDIKEFDPYVQNKLHINKNIKLAEPKKNELLAKTPPIFKNTIIDSIPKETNLPGNPAKNDEIQKNNISDKPKLVKNDKKIKKNQFINKQPLFESFRISLTEEPRKQEDTEYLDLEKLYLKENSESVIPKININTLVDRSFNLLDKSKLIEEQKEKKSTKGTPKTTPPVQSTENESKKGDDKKKKYKIPITFEDASRLASISPFRDQIIDSYYFPKRYHIKTDLKPKKIQVREKQEEKKINFEVSDNITSVPQALESVDELNILENKSYKRDLSLKNLLLEYDLIKKNPSYDKFVIKKESYFKISFVPYFIFRIDAQKAVWDNNIKKWIAYNGDIRYWDNKKGLNKITHFKRLVLDYIKERPDHFLIKNKPMDRLTLKEGRKLITSLKKSRKKWREFEIDMYSKKFAFQLSTFLIILVGITIGQFHSRKLVFINSLFKAIIIFLLYFIIFQIGTSLAKISDIFPSYLAPWLGNVFFLVLAVFMIKKIKT